MSGAAESWAGRADRALEAAGYRRGGARSAVLTLLDSQPCALTATEIEGSLAKKSAIAADGRAAVRRPRGPVSRASIYRILDELEGLGLVQRVATGQTMIRFEPVRPAEHHHHHLVCNDCGAVAPFADTELERTIRELSERVPLAVSEHEIVLRGQCSECAPQQSRTSDSCN